MGELPTSGALLPFGVTADKDAEAGLYTEGFYEANTSVSSRSAERVLPDLLRTLAPASVVDVGCGGGAWLHVCLEHGVEQGLGLDGSHVDETLLRIPTENFRAVDLGAELRLDEEFDLAICLEVAEHLPAERADTFVADLCRLAPTVLFSAAIPGQGGIHHVNEQPQSYWSHRFEQNGYRPVDCLRGFYWDDDDIAAYFRQNMVVYTRDQDSARKLERRFGQWEMPLDVVHPTSLEHRVDQVRELKARRHSDDLGTMEILRLLPRVTSRAAKARLAPIRAQRAERRRLNLVAEHLDLRPLASVGRVPPGEVWAITMVKDEQSLIEFTVEHLLGEGVDRIVILDNLSTDGTRPLLDRMAREVPLIVADDRLVAYYQGAKMTLVARAAAEAGAEWIVPFDADEIWCARDGSLGDRLRSSTADIVEAAVYNHLPHPDDDDAVVNPFVRMVHRAEAPSDFVKVAFRAFPTATVRQGNHDVVRPGRRGSGLVVRHFPFRSVEQAIDKIRSGKAAMDATDLTAKASRHWRELGLLDDDEIHRWYIDWITGQPMVVDPAPYRGLRPSNPV